MNGTYWMTPTRAESARIWLTAKLLACAWRALPRKHPACRGICEAACAISDPALADDMETELQHYAAQAQELRRAVMAMAADVRDTDPNIAAPQTEIVKLVEAANAGVLAPDANLIPQPHWGHLWTAFVEGAKEARANPDAQERDFSRAADGYCKRVLSDMEDCAGAVPQIGPSGSDWEAVGGFRYDRHAGWQQVAAEHANDPDVTTLYRKRNDGVAMPLNDQLKEN